MDGYTVLDRMKRDERTQHIPVIILSMVDVPAEIERCDALGCNVYITNQSRRPGLLRLYVRNALDSFD